MIQLENLAENESQSALQLLLLGDIDLRSAVLNGSSQEAFLKDCVHVVVVQVNQLFEQGQRRQTFFKLEPLVVNHLIENVLFNQRHEIVHLLAKELELAQLLLGFEWKSLSKIKMRVGLLGTQGDSALSRDF